MGSQPTGIPAADDGGVDQLNREYENVGGIGSGGLRRWTIVLGSGAEVTFDAAWDWPGDSGPAQMILEHRKYMRTGSKPHPQKMYAFPETNGSTRMAAAIACDIADVQAIVQVFDRTNS